MVQSLYTSILIIQPNLVAICVLQESAEQKGSQIVGQKKIVFVLHIHSGTKYMFYTVMGLSSNSQQYLHVGLYTNVNCLWATQWLNG